jgi:hypothetical protein
MEQQLWDVQFQTVPSAAEEENALQFYRHAVIPIFKATHRSSKINIT